MKTPNPALMRAYGTHEVFFKKASKGRRVVDAVSEKVAGEFLKKLANPQPGLLESVGLSLGQRLAEKTASTAPRTALPRVGIAGNIHQPAIIGNAQNTLQAPPRPNGRNLGLGDLGPGGQRSRPGRLPPPQHPALQAPGMPLRSIGALSSDPNSISRLPEVGTQKIRPGGERAQNLPLPMNPRLAGAPTSTNDAHMTHDQKSQSGFEAKFRAAKANQPTPGVQQTAAPTAATPPAAASAASFSMSKPSPRAAPVGAPPSAPPASGVQAKATSSRPLSAADVATSKGSAPGNLTGPQPQAAPGHLTGPQQAAPVSGVQAKAPSATGAQPAAAAPPAAATGQQPASAPATAPPGTPPAAEASADASGKKKPFFGWKSKALGLGALAAGAYGIKRTFDVAEGLANSGMANSQYGATPGGYYPPQYATN